MKGMACDTSEEGFEVDTESDICWDFWSVHK
jgi:hypothetical protein